MNDAYTENLADFGFRELKELQAILAARLDEEGLPTNFVCKGVRPAFNRNSGYVFLTNDEYQVCMINSETGNLEIFHTTPYDGYEGFLSDLAREYKPEDLNADDVEYIRKAAEAEDFELPESWKENEATNG